LNKSAQFIDWSLCIASILSAAALGGILGVATAQERASGQLGTACMGQCTANGYEATFCESVCWVPDSLGSSQVDNLDWKCFSRCAKQGNRAEPCLASCQRF